MAQFIKDNINLPVSLHDSVITSMQQNSSASYKMDGHIILKFTDGFYIVNKKELEKTGEAYILLSGVDFDFSHIYYFKENKREKITFNQLEEDIENYTICVINEMYGYNQTKFSCSMNKKNELYEVEIEIYHFNKTRYEWVYKPIHI